MTRAKLKLAIGAFALLLCAGIATFVRHGRPTPVLRNWQEGRKAEFARQRMAGWPSVMLWAWERPEDFTGMRGGKYGVAFLAKTIYLVSADLAGQKSDRDGVRVRPRLQPLDVSPGTPLMAVVRVETSAGFRMSAYSSGSKDGPRYSEKQIERAAEEIVNAANLPRVSAVQIDFDASSSEHEFYRGLLAETRRGLPKETRLSITALASWCVSDRWLEELPDGTIDEAVPMLFRMGPGAAEVVRQLRREEEFPLVACRNSVGVSTDELLSRDILGGKLGGADFLTGKRVYVFSPHSWSADGLPEVAPMVASKPRSER